MGAVPGGALIEPPLLLLEGVSKRYGGTVVLDGVNLSVAPGEFVALLGRSGAGKSTLLRLVAGFDVPDTGTIRLGGDAMAGRPPSARPCAMVFQSYALFPHLSVFDNVAYGLRRAGMAREDILSRVTEALASVGLAGFGARRPEALSGGERQRVALVRALVGRPPLVLLDEPLGALDAGLRERTGVELRALQRASGAAFLMVTHDQAEALSLADRVGVLESGRLVQIGPPRDVWARPATRFVAEFVGGANLLEGVVGRDGRIDCAALGASLRAPESGGGAGERVCFALRPERIAVLDVPPLENGAAGEVRAVAFRGGEQVATVVTDAGGALRLRLPADAAVATGARLAVGWWPEALVRLAG